jgi:hypothetical protein
LSCSHSRLSKRRHGANLRQRRVGLDARDGADDGGGDFAADQRMRAERGGTEHGFEGLRAIEEVEGHAVLREQRQAGLPAFEVREEILAQGKDDAQGRGAEVEVAGEAAILGKALLERARRAILQEIGHLLEPSVGLALAGRILAAEGEDFLELIEEEHGRGRVGRQQRGLAVEEIP